MTERIKIQSFEELLSAFPPQQEIVTGKNGNVTYRVSRDPKGLILYAVPERAWLKRGEQQENRDRTGDGPQEY